jgi:hypothetical protein
VTEDNINSQKNAPSFYNPKPQSAKRRKVPSKPAMATGPIIGTNKIISNYLT